MDTINELDDTNNWLSKLQDSDKISGSTFGDSDNAMRLAKKKIMILV